MRGYEDPRDTAGDEDERGYDERVPRSRRESPEAPPAQVVLPPGKQWVRDGAGMWLQIDAPGVLSVPRRSGFDALWERLADDPVAAFEKIGLAALAIKKVVEIVAPKQEPVAEVIAREVERAVAPIASKIATAPARPIEEVVKEAVTEARAGWEAEKKAAELTAKLHAVEGQLGAMRAEARAAREAPPPPPPKTLAEQVEHLKQTYEALPFARRDADADGTRPQSMLGAVTELLGTVLNSDVGNKIAEVAAPAIEESTQVKRLQRQLLEQQLAQQQPPPQQFMPAQQQFAQQQAHQQRLEQEQFALHQQQLAEQRAQQFAEQQFAEQQAIVDPSHSHAFTHAAHAAPAIIHPSPHPATEADDAGE